MWRTLAVALFGAVLAVGCSPTAEKGKTEALEKRVSELEQQLAQRGEASPSPTAQPAPAGGAASPVAPPASRPAPASAGAAAAREEPAGVGAPAASAREERRPLSPPPAPLVIPEGTELTLVLETSVSSATSQAGDAVTARVEKATGPDGSVVLPGGTSVEGRVTDARPSGKVKGRARLVLDFDRIVIRGRPHPLSATGLTMEASPQHRKDAATIGGGAALGGIIGAIAGGKGGFGKGAAVGAAAGTGAVLLTKGKEVELPSGAHVAVQVRDTLRF